MAALPQPIPPVGAGGITLQAAQRAVGNALRTTPDPNPFRDNGATPRLKAALNTYITNFEAWQLQQDPTVIHNLQCDIALWGLRHWPITVNSDETRDLVISYRFNYRKTGMPTTHPLARVARLISDRLLLIEAFEKAKDLGITTITDYYGSKRNLSIGDKIYSMFADFSTILIDLEWYRPLITSKDRTDYSLLLAQYPSRTPPPGNFIAILTDIYCAPKQIINELDQSGCRLALFATQIFPKASIAGCHFDRMTYVNHNGTIHQAPGSQDHEWGYTYANEEWLTHRGFHINNTQPMTWEWDLWTTVSDYRLFRLLPTPGYVPLDGPFGAPVSKNSLIEHKTILPRRWRSKLQSFLSDWLCRPTIFNRPLKVFLPALDALATKYINKTRQTFQESNCQTEVGNIIDKKEYRAFWDGLRENSGITKEDVALETATYIFWGNLEEDFRMRRRTAESLGDTWRAFKDMKQNMTRPDATIPWPVLILTAAVACAGFYHYRNRGLADTLRAMGTGRGLAMSTSWNLPDFRGLLKSVWESLNITKFLPTYKEVKSILPDENTISKTTEQIFQTQHSLTTPETFITTITNLGLGVMMVTAPIYEELFKKSWKWGALTIGIFEGMGNPLLTCFKVWWHTYVTSLPNRIQAHHSWNTGVSVAMLITQPNSVMFGAVAKYGWPLHLYSIISPSWKNNLGWFIGGFGLQWSLTKYATMYPTIPAPGMVSPFYALLLLVGYCLYRCFPRGPRSTGVEQFREDYSNVESHLINYPETMALTYQQAELPAITETQTYKDAPIDPDVTDELETRPSVYVLLGTTSMMYRPYGFNQFYHAYKQRNVVPCLITPTCEQEDDECELHSLKWTQCPIGVEWRHAANWTITLIKETIGNLDMQVVPLKSQDWIKHFNGAAKKQRARDGIAQRNTGYLRKETSIFLKSDEVLFGREGFMKPRTVKALHPTIQASCYKEVGECMDRLKIFFNQDQVHRIRYWSVTFSIGSGKTSSELNTWFNCSKEWVSIDNMRAAIIVAGDDFFAIVKEKDSIYYLENDFAKFDRTQGVHAQDAEASILEVLGMSEQISYLLFTTMNLQPRYENKRLQFQSIFHMPAQRATGAPDTTIGNTINNIVSVIYSLMRSNSFEFLARDQAFLGLEAKLQTHEDPSHATFLKGWWLPCDHEYYWLPLPSQTVKMGKILTLPTQIFKHLSEDSAWRSAAKSMGCSYKNVPFEYPLFGAQLQRYSELDGEVIDLAPFQPNDGHKIVLDEMARVDKYVARSYMANRYNLTYEDIVEMEAEMLSMPFPGLAVHHGWAKVVSKDYG